MNRSLIQNPLLGLAMMGAAMAAEPAQVLNVWPAGAPGEKGDIAPEKYEDPHKSEPVPITRLMNVSTPTIAVYPAPKEKNTGTAVLICPGGGYHILAMNLEGEEVAAWLNSIGVTAIVLKYRVPARKNQPKELAPLQDAQRAVSLVRSHAREWNIEPDRIGILGFSAGGHLSACASTNFDTRKYEAIDDIDKVSARPDFAVLCYPAYLYDSKAAALSPEIRVSAQTPPTFFVHAGDDKISPENSIQMSLALRKAGVPAELHVFTDGGHGFGLRPSTHACCEWPKLCEAWMRARKLIPRL